ncbi:16321_t:CDS:2 [Dentiscutata erythropus]|uniref:16321_t:CDS:1 n=1 Tax=Dentiscutata erythropus TaxID=1348616 RepID=A0A9N8VCU1_9GLOM|nr:16321_t:CDS:2 [Dentiscutata erythropus]
MSDEEGKPKIDFLVVWALGAYPVEQKDYNIEMSLFVPLNSEERDLEIQVIFEKDSFFCVGGKIILGFIMVVESNKCPLKVSLVGVPQEMPIEIKDDIVINTYDSSQESLIFVVGQLEIIRNEFYVYSKDINYVDTHFSNKKRFLDGNISQNSSVSKSSIRSKLLATHQNIVGDSEEKLDNKTSVDSNNFVDNYDFNAAGSSCSAKHAKFDDFDESFDDTSVNFESKSRSKEDGCLSGCEEEGVKEAVKDSKNKRNFSRSEGKKPVERSLHSSLRGSNSVKT